MKLKIMFGKILYKTIGTILPSSASKYGGNIGRGFRNKCAQLIMASTGNGINVNKKSRFGQSVVIGDNSSIGMNCFLQGAVHLGDNVMMAENVIIFTTNHRCDRLDIPMCRQGTKEERPVFIGDDVWIGDSVIICPGVKIGKGAVLGAGSVIRKNVPDYAVIIGNPAQIIRFRNGADANETNSDN